MRPLRKLCFSALACALGFLLLEGSSSAVLFLYELFARSQRPPAERVHTRYDPEVGWVAIPNLYVPDLYGPGIYLRTNSSGFRNGEEVDVKTPPGKMRIVCSGDSFTLGHGVDNDNTWCAFLSSFDQRLQVVNMGQGGYGIDQAYLWYRRDGSKLEHQVHIFAFISDDFTRMQFKEFFGYGKPRLRLRNGELITENIPVPRSAFYMPWLTQNRGILGELRSVDLSSRLIRRILPSSQGRGDRWLPQEEVFPIALKVFEALQEINNAKGSTLVLVHLPVKEDYEDREFSDTLRRFLREENSRRGILFVDLIEEFRKLPRTEMEKIAAHHYTVEGNRYIAKQLWAKLNSLPEVSKHWSRLP